MSQEKLEELHRLFNTGEELTQADIATRLNVTDRTARRWLERYKEAFGRQLSTRQDGHNKVYFLEEQDREIETDIGVFLSEQELFALSVAAEASLSALMSTPLADSIESAFKRLMRSLEERVFTFDPGYSKSHWYFEPTVSSNMDAGVFSEVASAVRDCRQVKMRYYSAGRHSEEWRTIDPYGLVMRNGTWLVVGWCHKRREFRDFSLAGIRAVEHLDTYYHRRPFDIQEHFRDRFAVMNSGEVETVRIKVSGAKAESFRRKSYHPTQQIESELEDGSLIVSYEVNGISEIAAFIRGWGPSVIALDPPELVEKMATQAREMVRNYEAMTADRI